MKPRLRYLSALLVNVVLPWLAYRLALPHGSQLGALLASAVPLIAWMSWDLLRYRHFDALSALVLAGIVLSVLARLAGGDARMQSIEDPMVSGMIGASFLASLGLRRPLVFYLARSTMSREDHRSAESFERHWRERPTLAAYIRLMTLVWGVGMIGENILRVAVVWQWPNDPRSALASNMLRYGVYAGLTLWTFWLRRRIKQDALRYPEDDGAPVNPLASP
ncbi:hypothetical protein FVF58_18595 [Paraburkholderia panacisoli]|uniref:Intracellular septation protein A n=1 Tax=Paraburkholderia panacisoli TaxID=2603818 RepID=A0A5B0H6W2_9BURK|nr:VC0807 family protein [Paraburkholderia panacisoli]KAA1010861.1 hypothetical protein FVF58_18595 [Paraburkholderia panacisoli]